MRVASGARQRSRRLPSARHGAPGTRTVTPAASRSTRSAPSATRSPTAQLTARDACRRPGRAIVCSIFIASSTMSGAPLRDLRRPASPAPRRSSRTSARVRWPPAPASSSPACASGSMRVSACAQAAAEHVPPAPSRHDRAVGCARRPRPTTSRPSRARPCRSVSRAGVDVARRVPSARGSQRDRARPGAVVELERDRVACGAVSHHASAALPRRIGGRPTARPRARAVRRVRRTRRARRRRARARRAALRGRQQRVAMCARSGRCRASACANAGVRDHALRERRRWSRRPTISHAPSAAQHRARARRRDRRPMHDQLGEHRIVERR